MALPCNRCGETPTMLFHHNRREAEQLCWPCRKPEVLRRARQGSHSKAPSGEASSTPNSGGKRAENRPTESGQARMDDYL